MRTKLHFPEQKYNSEEILIYEKPEYNTQYISLEFPLGGLTQILYDEKGEKIELPPGTAHLLEHLILDSKHERFFMNYMINGARVNGYTHLGSSIYNIEMANFNIEILDKFVDKITNQQYDEEILKKQKNIILEEIKTRRAFPTLIEKNLKALLKEEYNHFTVVGTKETVESITLSTVNQVQQLAYSKAKFNLISFGPNEPSNLFKWHKELPQKNDPKILTHKDNNKDQLRGLISSNNTDTLVITFVEDIYDPKRLVAREVQIKLFLEAYRKDIFESIRYDLGYHIDFFEEKGITIVNIVTAEENFSIIKSRLTRIINDGFINVPIEKFQMAQTKLQAELLSNFDYPERISSKLHWLFRNGYTINEYTNLINDNNLEQVKENANRMFKVLSESF